MIQNADRYFSEVARFQQSILEKQPNSSQYAERIGIYLSCIYLWPLHILLHPSSPELDQIGTFMERLHLTLNEDRRVDAKQLLAEFNYFEIIHNRGTPLAKALEATLSHLQLLDPNLPPSTRPFSKYEFIRLKTDLIVQRGLYEGWHHDHPVRFRKEEVHPLEAMHRFLDILRVTELPIKGFSYELRGIVPAINK
jgi:hypothetical protein